MTITKAPASAGFSLIEMILATAIVGGLIMMVGGLYAQLHDQVNDSEAIRETEELRGYVQSILNQPELCAPVFNPRPNPPITWNYDSNPDIFKSSLAIGSLMVGANPVAVGAPYSMAVKVVDMRLREPLPTEGGRSRSKVTMQSPTGLQVYDVVAAKFVITTQSKSAYSARPITRTADVLLAFQNNEFRLCASAKAPRPQADGDFICDSSTYTGSLCPKEQDFFCQPIYYIDGFNQDGSPSCNCIASCFSGPEGPKGSSGGGKTKTKGQGASGSPQAQNPSHGSR